MALAGETYLQNGDANEAARYFEMAAKLDPKSTPTRTAVALTHLAKGETERAFRELEDTAAGDTGIRADLALIAASMRKRDFDRALVAIDALEKKQPDNPLAQNLRGGVMLAKKDVPAARKSFEKAVTMDKGYVPAAANLARLDVAEKKPDDAKKRFEAVLEKDPKNVQALLALAELKARAGGSADEVAAPDQQGHRRQPEGAGAEDGFGRAAPSEQRHAQGDRRRAGWPRRVAGRSAARPRAGPRAAGSRRYRRRVDDVRKARAAAARFADTAAAHGRSAGAGEEQRRSDAKPAQGARSSSPISSRRRSR